MSALDGVEWFYLGLLTVAGALVALVIWSELLVPGPLFMPGDDE